MNQIKIKTRRTKEPRILPGKFRSTPFPLAPFMVGLSYTTDYNFKVIITEEWHGDQWWKHASCSYPNRLPSWENIKEVKDIFIGREMMGLHIIPKQSEYVNEHPYCMHIWVPLETQDFDFLMKAQKGG